MQHNQAIFESLFKRNFSDAGNADFLKEITAAHPYFSPAQFYLLQQTEENSGAFEKQAAKTNILFNNPYWLNFQLQLSKQNAVPKEELFVKPEWEIADNIAHVEDSVDHVDEKGIEPEVQTVADIYHVYEKEIELPEVQAVDHIEHDEEKKTEQEPEITTNIYPVDEKEIELPEIQTVDHIEHDEEKETEQEPEMVGNNEYIDEPGVESGLEIADHIDHADEKEIEPMKIELKMPVEKNAMEEIPLFEPMHMVDYFASQGIKLSEEVQPADKLGKQLKSFTEWLKTMKKIHTVNDDNTPGQTDVTIQNLAEKSNTEDEVLTVSMADVFAKQGKTDKAIEVLQKLSLLNPAKSAYFAAKIEHLKGL